MRRTLALLTLGGALALLSWGQTAADDDQRTLAARRAMVADQLRGRDITSEQVLAAMANVPRHRFVPAALRSSAYLDHPLPIGEGQTISQPYIVALMTQLLDLESTDRVLEVGTGSGYQAAVLAEVVGSVYSIEIRPELHARASGDLAAAGYGDIELRAGDGYYGWAEQAPFDHIIITAAVDHIPPPLLDQLRPGGTMVLPLGNPLSYQNLVRVTKEAGSPPTYQVDMVTGVRFVPMTGAALDR